MADSPTEVAMATGGDLIADVRSPPSTLAALPDGGAAFFGRRCATCGEAAPMPFAIAPGMDAEYAPGGIMVRRPVADRMWCTIECRARAGGSGLASGHSRCAQVEMAL